MIIPVSIDMHQANYCQINSKSIHQTDQKNIVKEEREKKTHHDQKK